MATEPLLALTARSHSMLPNKTCCGDEWSRQDDQCGIFRARKMSNFGQKTDTLYPHPVEFARLSKFNSDFLAKIGIATHKLIRVHDVWSGRVWLPHVRMYHAINRGARHEGKRQGDHAWKDRSQHSVIFKWLFWYSNYKLVKPLKYLAIPADSDKLQKFARKVVRRTFVVTVWRQQSFVLEK